LLELWLFNTHNTCQKLVLKTFFRHQEVDNGALSGSFGLVMRVDQFRLKVELESLVDFDFFRSQLHEEVLAALNEGA
jgi:hypothetical protein